MELALHAESAAVGSALPTLSLTISFGTSGIVAATAYYLTASLFPLVSCYSSYLLGGWESTLTLVNVIHYINQVKEKNHSIVQLIRKSNLMKFNIYL